MGDVKDSSGNSLNLFLIAYLHIKCKKFWSGAQQKSVQGLFVRPPHTQLPVLLARFGRVGPRKRSMKH